MKRLVVIFIVFICILLIRFSVVIHNSKTYHDGEMVSVDTLLLSDIDNYNKSSSLLVTLPDSFPPQRLSIIFPAGNGIHFGQHIHSISRIKYTVLKDGNTVISMYFPKFSIIPSLADSLLGPLYTLRKNIIEGYQLSLSDIYSTLLLGIVLALKRICQRHFLNNFKQPE